MGIDGPHFRRALAGLPEIAADPVLQDDGFPHVDDSASPVMHDIDAGRLRQDLQGFGDLLIHLASTFFKYWPV